MKDGLAFLAWILIIIGLAIPPVGGILFIVFGLLGIIDPEF